MRGHIHQKGEKYYVILDIGVDENGKRKQKWHSGYRTKKEAKIALEQMLADIQRGEYVSSSNISLAQFLDEWLEDSKKPHLAPKTYASYSDIIRLYLNPLLGHKELSKLTPSLIQKYYTHLRENSTLSNSSINYHHRLLSQALNHAVKWLYIAKNPCDIVEPPKRTRKEMQAWNFANIQKAHEVFKDTPIYLHVMLAIYTGMRAGEIGALKWTDIDFDNAVCTVRRTAQRVMGNLIFKEPKTEKSIRRVVLQQALVELLRKDKKKQMENRLLFGSSYKLQFDGYISTWADGSFMEPDYVGKKFHKTLLKNPDLPMIRFHDLRHTNASMMLASGIDMKTMSERLGHSQIGITMDLYAHVSVEMQRKAVKKLEEFMQ